MVVYSLSKSRSFSVLTIAQFIVILTLLPFTFQFKDSQLVIYSNGPCLIARFFESGFTDSTPSFPSLKPLEVPLRIAGKNCSQNDPGWITSIDYFMDPVTLNFYLIWADSDSQTLWTGRVNSTNYHIDDVKQLRDSNSFVIGPRVRSLIVDQASGKLFVSFPSTHRIEVYNLINGLSMASQQREKNHQKELATIINLNRTVLLNEMDKIGKVLYNPNVDKLFWIESNKCLWSGTPTVKGIRDKRLLMCNHPLSDEIVYSAVIDPNAGDIYVFYEKGRIERLSGPNWTQRSTIITNCLAEEKYKDAKFYTIEMRKEKQFLRFYASDTQHYAFRQISLIKRFETGQNDDGLADEYILDPQNSGILFTDQPNIYDFIFPGDDGLQSSKMVPSIGSVESNQFKDGNRKNEDQLTIFAISKVSSSYIEGQSVSTTENEIIKIVSNSDHKSSYPPSMAKYRSTMKPNLELINRINLPEVNPIKELDKIPTEKLDTHSVLSKMIVSSSSPSPIENLPPQITLLTVTSSSTIIYWLYAFLAIGLIIASLWTVATLIGLRRNYQKVFSDDNSLKENLTSVKY